MAQSAADTCMLEGRRRRHAWSRLQRSLARTLDDLHLVCEAGQSTSRSELVESTLRYLSLSVDEFALLAGAAADADAEDAGCDSAGGAATAAAAERRPDAAGSRSGGSSDAGHAGAGAGPRSRLARSTSASAVHMLADGLSPQSSIESSAGSSSGASSIQAAGGSSALSSESSSPCCSRRSSAASSCASDPQCRVAGPAPWDVMPAPAGSAAAPGSLHDKLSSPDRLRKKTPHETKAAAEERQARAERLRERLAEERLARLQEQLAKQQRAAAGKATDGEAAQRSANRHQRSELLRAAHLRRIKAKAGDETRKVHEVSFISRLTTEGKKADLQQRLTEGEARRAEALAAILAKQQDVAAALREAAERRRAAEAERLKQLEARQRRKQEAQARMNEDRRAAAAAREAAKAAAHALAQERSGEAARQQQAAELSARVNARLREAEQRRLQHLEMIKERACQAVASSSAGGGSSSSSSGGGGDSIGGSGDAATPAAAAAGSTPQLNVHAPCFTPGGSDSAAQQQGSQSPHAAPAAPVPSEVLRQLQGRSQSIVSAGVTAAASSSRTALKGARRRMAKAKQRLLQPCCFMEPEQGRLLSATPEAQQLLAAWGPQLALLNVRQPVACSPAAARQCFAGAGDSSSSSSLVSSPRSSNCSCQSTAGHAALLGSSLQCDGSSSCGGGGSHSPACSSTPSPSFRVLLSRSSSSCCECDSVHSSSRGSAASRAGDEHDALAAVIASARAHLPKQPQLVQHLARRAGLLHMLCQRVLAAATAVRAGSGKLAGEAGAAEEAKTQQNRLQQARMCELLSRLLELPANLEYLLCCGQLLPDLVAAVRAALDSVEDAGSMQAGGSAASVLGVLLQALVSLLEHSPGSEQLVDVQEQLVAFLLAAGVLGRISRVLRLFDQPGQDVTRPVPPHVLQCLRLLGCLTAVRRPCEAAGLLPDKRWPAVAPNAAAVILELQATSMAGILSLLTAVLLHAAPTCTPAEASSKQLPPNFCEAAQLVMAVLNNVCRLDLLAAQHMLQENGLELYHLASFLLGYCLNRWPAPMGQQPLPGHQQPGPAPQAAGLALVRPVGCRHPIAQLLNQVLLLLGFFCVLNPDNQAMLQWGCSPSILQRLLLLPRAYLEQPQLQAVFLPTLLCACHGNERSCAVAQQHLPLLLQWLQQQAQLQQPLGPGQQQPGKSRRRQQRQRRQQLEQPQLEQQQPQDQQPEQQPQPQQQPEPQSKQQPQPEQQPLPSLALPRQRSGSAPPGSTPGCRRDGPDAFSLGCRFPLELLPAAVRSLQEALAAPLKDAAACGAGAC